MRISVVIDGYHPIDLSTTRAAGVFGFRMCGRLLGSDGMQPQRIVRLCFANAKHSIFFVSAEAATVGMRSCFPTQAKLGSGHPRFVQIPEFPGTGPTHEAMKPLHEWGTAIGGGWGGLRRIYLRVLGIGGEGACVTGCWRGFVWPA